MEDGVSRGNQNFHIRVQSDQKAHIQPGGYSDEPNSSFTVSGVGRYALRVLPVSPLGCNHSGTGEPFSLENHPSLQPDYLALRGNCHLVQPHSENIHGTGFMGAIQHPCGVALSVLPLPPLSQAG